MISAAIRIRLGLLGWLASSGAAYAEDMDDLAALVERTRIENDIPSIAVAVARDGRILWEAGFGWADREARRPATEHTLYSLASISKPITATGLMVLVERGALDLDRPVDAYLGAAKLRARVGDAGAATVRRVANHTSGLPLHYQFFYENAPPGPLSMDETILRYGNLVTAPGERFQYSNLGYGVLDYLIERVSGMSYADFMRQEVFVPLGLSRCSIHVGAGLSGLEATRYDPSGAPIPFYDFDHRGGSAVYCSAHDLIRFAMFHLKNRLPDQRAILGDAAIDAMQQTAVDSDIYGAGSGYGVGWATRQAGGTRLVLHTGSMPGVRTLLLLAPAENLALALLSNSAAFAEPRWDLAGRILDRLLPGREWSLSVAAAPDERPPFVPPPDLVGSWKGTIDAFPGPTALRLEIRADGDVHVKLGAGLGVLLDEARFEGGFLRGRFLADYRLEEAVRPDYLQLDLKLRNRKLDGSLNLFSRRGAVTQWVELHPAPDDPRPR